MTENRKILLHVCCAPCATTSVESLLADSRDVTLYFSNSNINSKEEFEKRLGYVEKLAGIFAVNLEVDAYCHDDWLEHVKGLENEPEKGLRCAKCFEWNLGRAAERAVELGIDNFTTSLTLSPHKISEMIFAAGNKYPGFENWDFKNAGGFARSLELTTKFGLYRQNYCGCEFAR